MSPDRLWRKANLGLGGNLGDPAASMAAALKAFSGRSDCRIVSVSRLFRTPPWGKTDQAWFFNACALIETLLQPDALLELCQALETRMNRVRTERWGPRTLDIDVLTYEGVTSEAEHLLLPHPRIAERAFVLLPLCDYAPDTRIGAFTAGALLADVDTSGIEPMSLNGDWWRETGAREA